MEFYLHSFGDRIFLAALALIAALLLGGPASLHRILLLDVPARLSEGFLSALERKLNRSHRSPATRRRRGALAVGLVFVLCLWLGLAVGWVAHLSPWGWVPEAALMALMLPARCSREQARAIQLALRAKDPRPAFALVAVFSRRDEPPAELHAAVRASVEYLALRFSRRMVAPVFWYLAFGLPAMLFVTALSVMDGKFGARSTAYGAFSGPIARLDDVAQLLPARLAALLLAAAALFSPGCHPLRALRGAVDGSAKTASPNSGVVLGAMAGALNVALAGPRMFLGAPVKDEWIDCGTARADAVHLARANYLFACACCLLSLAMVAMNVRRLSLETAF